MKVILAKSAGFCFGVMRAVKSVYDNLEKKPDHIYTYGPIIHNETVVQELSDMGVSIINDGDDLSKLTPGLVILRSHGVSLKAIENLKEHGFTIVNSTCPFVKKIHQIVQKFDREGYHIVITGNEQHAEVKGIIGWIDSKNYNVIQDASEVDTLPFKEGDKVCLVSQTTFNYKKFELIVEIIKKKGYDLKCLNTICNATSKSQTEARELAGKVDVMIVIGGKNSSNSHKLYEICKEQNKETYFIQTVKDLDFSVLQSVDTVGITAGASTPKKIIEEVQGACQNKALNRC